jgi:hypothetical protein
MGERSFSISSYGPCTPDHSSQFVKAAILHIRSDNGSEYLLMPEMVPADVRRSVLQELEAALDRIVEKS